MITPDTILSTPEGWIKVKDITPGTVLTSVDGTAVVEAKTSFTSPLNTIYSLDGRSFISGEDQYLYRVTYNQSRSIRHTLKAVKEIRLEAGSTIHLQLHNVIHEGFITPSHDVEVQAFYDCLASNQIVDLEGKVKTYFQDRIKFTSKQPYTYTFDKPSGPPRLPDEVFDWKLEYRLKYLSVLLRVFSEVFWGKVIYFDSYEFSYTEKVLRLINSVGGYATWTPLKNSIWKTRNFYGISSEPLRQYRVKLPDSISPRLSPLWGEWEKEKFGNSRTFLSHRIPMETEGEVVHLSLDKPAVVYTNEFIPLWFSDWRPEGE